MTSMGPKSIWKNIFVVLLLCGVLAKVSRVIWREYGPVSEERQEQIRQVEEVRKLLNDMKRGHGGSDGNAVAQPDSAPAKVAAQDIVESAQKAERTSLENDYRVEVSRDRESREESSVLVQIVSWIGSALFGLLFISSVLMNATALVARMRLRKELREQGVNDNDDGGIDSELVEHHASMLLVGCGAGAVAAYFLLAQEIRILSLLGAIVAFLGYCAVVQSFRRHDNAVQMPKQEGMNIGSRSHTYGGVAFGLALIGTGLYLIWR